MNEVSESMRTGFWIVAGIFVVFSMFRGWREGPSRMIAGLLALAVSGAAGYFGGRALVPVLRAALDLPDFALLVLGGAACGLTVYGLASLLIVVLLRRTADQESGTARLFFGVGGAIIGFAVGLGLVWVALLGLRLAGTIADGRIEAARSAESRKAPANPAAHGVTTAPAADAEPPPKLVMSLSRLKASVDAGATSAVLDKVDVIPQDVYDTLNRVARVVGNSHATQKFLEFPGAEKLGRHPRMAELAGRPEIAEALRRKAYVGLLRHPAVLAAANDPDLAADLRAFDLNAALDYALGKPGAASPTPAQP